MPAQTRSNGLTVTQPGAVVQDILFTGGDLIIDADNVTVRRVKLQGGRISNTQGGCANGLVVEDSTLEPPPGQTRSGANDTEGAVGVGGYTARRVKIWNRAEGFRVGGNTSGCGPVQIENSFARVTSPSGCGDWHGDGLQGYTGPPLSVHNVTIDFVEDLCGGTAPFFVPSGQGNTSAEVNGLLVKGGGISFRMGVPGSVRGLKIVDRSWYYNAVDVKCSALSFWEAQRVTIDANYKVTANRGAQRCSGTGGYEPRERPRRELLRDAASRGDGQHLLARELHIEHRLAMRAAERRAAGDLDRLRPAELPLERGEARGLHGQRDEVVALAGAVDAGRALGRLARDEHAGAEDRLRLGARHQAAGREAAARLAGRLALEQLLEARRALARPRQPRSWGRSPRAPSACRPACRAARRLVVAAARRQHGRGDHQGDEAELAHVGA